MALLTALRRDYLVGGAYLEPRVQALFETQGFHLSTTHFYGPVATVEACVAAAPGAADDAETRYGCSLAQQAELQDALLAYAPELEGVAAHAALDGGAFWWDNGMLPPLDALTVHGWVRARKPRRIVEVGCGFSTAVAAGAAWLNDEPAELVCVEPYASARLRQTLADYLGSAVLRVEPVQDTPLEVFDTLAAGDLLYIDTSHVLKHGSDVDHVLPRLALGVWVHFHDVFLPEGYPAVWATDIGIRWNEQLALDAVLVNSGRYAVRHAALAERLGHLPIWDLTQNLSGARGAGLWLETVG